jgi:large subunit ribosomal protein L25
MYELKVSPRDFNKEPKAKNLRSQGWIPASYYQKGKNSLHFWIPENELKRTLQSGEHLINLQFEKEIDGDKSHLGVLNHIDTDPLKGFMHVELKAVVRGQKTKVTVPIVSEGTPAGTEEGGNLHQHLNEIEVECLPTKIPNEIVVNVEHLNVGDKLFMKEIAPPSGVSFDESVLEEEVFDVKMPKQEAIEEPETEEAGEEGAEASAASEASEGEDSDSKGGAEGKEEDK